MKTRKFIKLVFISISIIGFLFSCKKENKELTTVDFHIYNPVSGEAMANVKVAVYEQKDVTSALKLQNEYESNKIWEGVTDAYGKASHSFKTYKKDKYTYWHSVDENAVKEGNRKLLSQPEYAPLQKEKVNKVEYTYTIPASFVGSFKNVNCVDENDRFKFRFQKLYNTTSFGWSNWSLDQFGCYELIHHYNNAYEDYLICQYEVERNGITNTYLDTFYINPYSVDTFKIFY